MFTTDLRPMGEKEANNSRKNVQMQKMNRRPRINLPALRGFLLQFPGKVQRHLKSRFKRPTETEGSNREMFKLKDARFSLEKQMQAWTKNPVWDDDQPTSIEVVVPKGSLCQLNVKTNVGLPPDAIYNIVTDPDNRRVFKNIQAVLSRKVLLDEGSRQIVDLEQAAIWRFLWWSGTISVHVLVDQNRDDYSMKFKQVTPGFMKRFEGSWKVEPILLDEKLCHPFKPKTLSEYMSCTQCNGRIASKVTLQQLVEPAIVPPPPISWYLRGITSKTVEMLINDLVEEAARIKGVSVSATDVITTNPNLDQVSSNEIQTLDIKERWALRRRKSRRNL
ncbi:putative START-like domain superfamily protein [Helianthus annuus]|nr:putative START-like domain superfamily protein [Helianthus annuus]KAJ0868449.1 putative START-like domain superfamily protein [Helianthus annuus]